MLNKVVIGKLQTPLSNSANFVFCLQCSSERLSALQICLNVEECVCSCDSSTDLVGEVCNGQVPRSYFYL